MGRPQLRAALTGGFRFAVIIVADRLWLRSFAPSGLGGICALQPPVALRLPVATSWLPLCGMES